MTTHSQRALILYSRRRFINHLLTYLLTYIAAQSTHRVCTPHDDLWGPVVFYDDPSDLPASTDLAGFAARLGLPFSNSGLSFKQQPYILLRQRL